MVEYLHMHTHLGHMATHTSMDAETHTKSLSIKERGWLYPELSHNLVGAIYAVAKEYGKGFKEGIYQKALAEELDKRHIVYKQQQRIQIFSFETGKLLGSYVPDYVIDDKIIVELKASNFTVPQDIQQQLSYLKASEYEVGYLVNFSTPKLFLRRSIYTNDHKPYIKV